MARFDEVWTLLDGQVAAGRFPGYVAGIVTADETVIRAGGRTALDPAGPPMTGDTLFRIASVAKPMGGALTLSLVQDGVLALDDPIARWLPEMAAPRVLVDRDGPLDQTKPADRPVTVRHLLTGTSGWGVTVEDTPRQAAMMAGGVFPSALPPEVGPDEFVAGVAAIPLAFQPGDGWLYDTGVDVLGVLLARASGLPLPELMAERVLGPLSMDSTAFWATGGLATAYRPGPDGLTVLDPADGVFSRPARFPKLSGGLVSTVADVLRFYTAMAAGGAPVLTPESLAALTADALTAEQRRQAEPIVGPGRSWGLGTGVDVAAVEPWLNPGRWGWTGGTGTTADVDPGRGVVSVLLTQRAMAGPDDGFDDFWAAVTSGVV
jgi:CubicO group peptidase (beta-lactamase class C family)